MIKSRTISGVNRFVDNLTYIELLNSKKPFIDKLVIEKTNDDSGEIFFITNWLKSIDIPFKKALTIPNKRMDIMINTTSSSYHTLVDINNISHYYEISTDNFILFIQEIDPIFYNEFSKKFLKNFLKNLRIKTKVIKNSYYGAISTYNPYIVSPIILP